ncbi:hypothetical protein J6U76_00105 [bacterium]|nr:hypothetical protein [bacterium]
MQSEQKQLTPSEIEVSIAEIQPEFWWEKSGKPSFETILKGIPVNKKCYDDWKRFIAKKRLVANKICFALRKQAKNAEDLDERFGKALLAFNLAKMLYDNSIQVAESNLSDDQQKPFRSPFYATVGWTGLTALQVTLTMFRDTSNFSELVSIHKKIAKTLTELNFDVNDHYDMVLKRQILHYQVQVLKTDQHLADSFKALQSAYAAAPDDESTILAYGWLLHDCLTQAMYTLNDRELIAFFYEEFSRLHLSDELKVKDPILVECQKNDLHKATTFLSGVQEARTLLWEKDNAKASLDICMQILAKNPHDWDALLTLGDSYSKSEDYLSALSAYEKYLKGKEIDSHALSSAVWAFVKGLKKWCYSSVTRPLPEKIVTLNPFLDYFKLSLKLATESEVKKVDLSRIQKQLREDGHDLDVTDAVDLFRNSILREAKLRSIALHALTKAYLLLGKNIPPDYAQFFMHCVASWGVDNLRPEDYKTKPSSDDSSKSFPSLCEDLVVAIYRCTLGIISNQSVPVGQFSWGAEFIKKAIDRFPEQVWFAYYYGKLLLAQGRQDEARTYILRVLHKKMKEFWAWQLLAETFPDASRERLIFLCRAACCGAKDKSYKINIHEMLGDVLRHRSMFPEALREYLEVNNIRAAKKWRSQQRDFDYDAWTKDITPAKSNLELYKRFAAEAEGLVLDNLPCYDGIVLARYTDKQTSKERIKFYWKVPDESMGQIATRDLTTACHGVKVGDPIRVWVAFEGTNPNLVRVVCRQEGHPWDAYPKTGGVISTHNPNRGHTLIAIGHAGKSAMADWTRFPELRKALPGRVCELATDVRKNGKIEVLHCALLPADAPLPSFARTFQANLSCPENRDYAFAGDVFIPSTVRNGFKNGAQVKGVAVSSFDKAKKRESWMAVSLHEV